MLRLLLTRHGESQWQVLGDEAGPDSALTSLGRRQADHLGRWLAGHIPIDHIYASPLKRAHETAQLVAAHLDLPMTLHEDLEEAWFDVPPTLPVFSAPSDILDSGHTDHAQTDENYQVFRSQVVRALRDILGRHHDGTILIVAHGGTIAMTFRLLLGSNTFTLNLGNTTLHSLTWNGSQWHIEYIDRWEHLRRL